MSTVLLEVRDGVASIQLNRPEALNSVNEELLDELEVALDTISGDQNVKVLVISGKGRSFCTGADLNTVLKLFDDWPNYVKFLYRLTDVFRAVEQLPIPTIARVHGFALAGGLELILCCDLAIASEQAEIGDHHANFGLIAGAGGIPRLVRRIGMQSALEILYTGRRLLAPEAASKGIVLKAVPEADLDGAIAEIAQNLAAKSRTALEYTKRAAFSGVGIPLVTALNEERAALLEYFSTSSHPREGIAAFLEKRAPNFDG